MDALILGLANGVGLQNAIGWFTPVYAGILNLFPVLIALFFYADKSSEYNKYVAQQKIDKLGLGYPEEKYDFIVVGAGSAGAVVANRLSSIYNVLLIERGGEPNPLQLIPGINGGLLSRPELDYTYLTVPQNNSCLSGKNRQCLWNAGSGLGGSSSINGMVYIRGHPSDYDRWAKITKSDKWAYRNVLPYFLKSEGYCDTCDAGDGIVPTINSKFHNSKGELTIRPCPNTPMVAEFLEAQKWAGVARGDLNAPYDKPTADPVALTLNGGRRASTYAAFLAPIREKRKTLTILKFARVTELVFSPGTDQVVGVKYERFNEIHTARAQKEVIISAGTVGTPQILMLSGIGPKDHLEELNIPVRCNLPVGKNLHDHVGTMVGPFLIDQPLSLLPGRNFNQQAVDTFLANGTGPFALHFLRAHALWLSKRAQKSKDENQWPDIHMLMSSNGVSEGQIEDYERVYNIIPEVTKAYIDPVAGNGPKDAFYFLINNARPNSRGTVTLASNRYADKPLVDPRYYEDPEDLKITVEAIERAVKFGEEAPPYKKIGAKLSPVPYPPCKKLPHRSDEYWKCFAQHLTISVRHYVGTARMGTPGSAVVDAELKVIGVKGLRVIDASVMPFIVSTNSHAATVMIGEKGSEFIISDHFKNEKAKLVSWNLYT